jgi:ABC-type bacteriocin/lantibiotic exporter with double-glycine peptidase domain
MLESSFEWLGNLPVSKFIGESLWIYPVVQAFHLVFMAILIGSLLIVDLRLLGSGMIRQPIAQVARDARPWLVGSLIGMLVTGLPQLMQNAMREYYSEFFWQKMYFLAAALIFTFTVRRKVAFSTEDRFNPALGKVVALVSIVLWGGVIVSGRLIGLFT